MACRSCFRFENRVLQGRIEVDNTGKGPVPHSADDCRNAIMSSANVHLLEEFLRFCEAKKINFYNEPAQGGNRSCDAKAKGSAESSSFRDDINTYFGDQLSASVVDDLCKLVNDNTHGKCMSCKIPAESLVLGVLHILSDAGKIIDDCKENAPPVGSSAVRANNINGNSVARGFLVHSQHLTRRSDVGGQDPMKCTRVPVIEGTGDPMKGNAFVATKFSSGAHILHHNARSSANDKAVTPIGNGVCGNLVVQNIPTNCPQQHMRNGEELAHSINCLATQNHEHTAAPNNGHGFVLGGLSGNPQNSNEGSEFLRGLQMNKQPLVFDTPLVMCHGNRTYHEAASILANAPTMNKKSKVEGGANQGNGLPDSYVCAHAPFSQVVVQGAHPVNPVMNLSDDNKAKSDESRYGIRTDPGQRFPVTKEDVHHYNAICGLARS